MLRINLLPSYVAQRRLNKKLIAAYTVGFAVVVACMLAYQFAVLTPQVATETALAADAVQAKSAIDALNQQATGILAKIAPITAKIQYVEAVKAYNLDYLKLYETVARWTSPKILYSSMAVSGNTLTIDAYTPSIEELGRYLQVMYHEPDFSGVSISSIPTPDQAAETIYMYKGNVVDVTGGPGSTGTGGPTSMGSMRNMAPRMGSNQRTQGGQSPMGGMNGGNSGSNASIPGVPPGVNFTLPPGVVLPGSTQTAQAPYGQGGGGQYGPQGGQFGQGQGQGSQYGPGQGSQFQPGAPQGYGQGQGSQYQPGAPQGYGQGGAGASYGGGSGNMYGPGGRTQGSLPSMMPRGGQGGRNGGPGAQGGGAAAEMYALMLVDPTFNPKYFKVVVRKTDGFPFVVTCALKETFTAPVPPGSSAAAPVASGIPGPPPAAAPGMNIAAPPSRPPSTTNGG